jgi:hypothetical protein
MIPSSNISNVTLDEFAQFNSISWPPRTTSDLCYFRIYLVSAGFYWINPAFNVSLGKKKACFNVRQYDTPKAMA